MIIERKNNELVLRLPANIDTLGLQRMLDYLKYKEVTIGSNSEQEEVDALAEQSKSTWWTENKNRFIQ